MGWVGAEWEEKLRRAEKTTGRWFVEKRLRDLTELETVDAQTGICGVVQPSLLSPAASGVCVHLPGCDPCSSCKHANKTVSAETH